MNITNYSCRVNASRVRVTHPFHPLFGRDLEFVKSRRNWRLDRVYFFDEADQLGCVPTSGIRVRQLPWRWAPGTVAGTFRAPLPSGH